MKKQSQNLLRFNPFNGMKTKSISLLLAIVVTGLPLLAQNIDKDEVEFEYIRLPLKPIEKNTRNYNIVLVQSAEAKNAELKSAYEADKKKAQEEYEERLADQKSGKNSQNSNSFGIVRDIDHNKSEPIVKRNVIEPKYLKVYTAEEIANKISINGLTKANSNPIIVTVNSLGFGSIGPNYESNGSQTAPNYSYTMEYKNPFRVKVEYNGKVYVDELVEGTNKTWLRNEMGAGLLKTLSEAQAHWERSSEYTLASMQNSMLQASLKEVNDFLNTSVGYSKLKREALIFDVKSKKVDYTDLNGAYILLKEGLLIIGNDEQRAKGKEKLTESSSKFVSILKESNITDKKSRINEDVTIACYFNLLEASIWLNEFSSFDEYVAKLKLCRLSNRENKNLESLNTFMKDQRLRFEANK